MIDLRSTFELLNWARQLSAGSAGSAEAPWLNSFWAAATAGAIGFVLAFWGGRVLRVAFVFAFMFLGAVLGKRFATSIQVDLLIGLVVGAGLAGAVGYVIYRWCLGVTVAVVTALIVAVTFSAPALLKERQAFEDFRLGVGTGEYMTLGTPLYSWADVRGYFWDQPRGREVVMKSLGPVALTAAVAFIWSLLVPRLASILATSVLGCGLLAAGAGGLMAMKWPATWARIQEHGGWAIAAVLFLWLFSMAYQITHPARLTTSSPIASEPAAMV